MAPLDRRIPLFGYSRTHRAPLGNYIEAAGSLHQRFNRCSTDVIFTREHRRQQELVLSLLLDSRCGVLSIRTAPDRVFMRSKRFLEMGARRHRTWRKTARALRH